MVKTKDVKKKSKEKEVVEKKSRYENPSINIIKKNGGIYIDEDIMDNYFFYIIINCSYDVFSYIRRK